MREEEGRGKKSEESGDGEGDQVEQKGKRHVRPMSNWRRQPTSLETQDRTSKQKTLNAGYVEDIPRQAST